MKGGVFMNPEEFIRKMWSSNAFMNVLKIEIKEVHCGGATLVMPIDFDIHTNQPQKTKYGEKIK